MQYYGGVHDPEVGMPEEQESEDLPQRRSAGRKTEIVLRLLRGEDLGAVSREIQVLPQELEDWRRVFLESGGRGLRRAGRGPTEREMIPTRGYFLAYASRVALRPD